MDRQVGIVPPFLSTLLTVLLLLPVSAGAIDLKPIQPAKPMQPVQPVKPGLTGIVPALPDLTVLQSSFVAYPPIVAGDPVGQTKLRFSVRNVGKAASGRFEVEITCGYTSPVCPGGFNGFSSVPPLAPGAMYEIKWPPLVSSEHTWQAGNYALIVNVDAGNAVKEVGEVPGSGQPALNEHIWDFTVGKGVPKVPSGLTLKPSAPTAVPSKSAGGLKPPPPPTAVSKVGKPGEERLINPQPEPPGAPKRITMSVTPKSTAPGQAIDSGDAGWQGAADMSAEFLRFPASTTGAINVPSSSRSIRKAPKAPSSSPAGALSTGKVPVTTSIRINSVIPLNDGRLVTLVPVDGDYEAKFVLQKGETSDVPDGSYVTRGGLKLSVAGGKVKPPKDTAPPSEDPVPDLGVALVGGEMPVVGEPTAEHFTLVVTNKSEVSVPTSKLSIECFYTPPVGGSGHCLEGGYFIYDFDLLEANQSVRVLWPPDFGNMTISFDGTVIEKKWQEGAHSVTVGLRYEGGTRDMDRMWGEGDDYMSFYFFPTVPGFMVQ